MNKKCHLSILLVSLLLAACKGIPYGEVDNTHDETILVSNHKVECRLYNAANASLCIQFKIKGDEDWIIENSHAIKSFNYAWGYDYELEVEVEDLDPAPSDGSDKSYTLKKEVKKSPAPVGGKFSLSIGGGGGIAKKTNTLIKPVTGKANTFKIYGDKEIETSVTIFNQVKILIAEDKALFLKLKHPESPSKPLIIDKVECSAPHDIFNNDKADGGCF